MPKQREAGHSLTVDATDPLTAWPALFACMTYPNDHTKWLGFRRSFAGMAYGAAADGIVPGDDGSLKGRIEDALLKPLGGVSAAMNESSAAHQKAMAAAFTGPGQAAGAVLCFTAQMHLSHSDVSMSINRAWAILKNDSAKGAKVSNTKSNFYDTKWKTWKPVAHLFAAFLVGRSCQVENERQTGIKPDAWDVEHLVDFLAWADWFRAWAVATKSDKAHAPILDETTTLRVVSGIVPYEPPLTRLNPARLRVATAYPNLA